MYQTQYCTALQRFSSLMIVGAVLKRYAFCSVTCVSCLTQTCIILGLPAAKTGPYKNLTQDCVNCDLGKQMFAMHA